MDEMTMIPLPELVKEIIKECGSLPASDDVSSWALESSRKIYLDDDIGYNIMEIQRRILRWNMEDAEVEREVREREKVSLFSVNDLTREPIWIYIMSYGGDLDYMWSMIDTITTSKTPIYTVNMGIAASAASLIFLAGHKRFMMPRSQIIIHEGSAHLAGDAVKVMDQSESYRKQLKQMKEYILERTEIPKTLLMKKRNNDWMCDAQFCLENGACERIIECLDEVC